MQFFHSKTSSPSLGVTNENGGHIHLAQSEKIVEIEDGYDERHGMQPTTQPPDDAGDHDDEESHGEDAAGADNGEEDEDMENPGEASIGNKLWTFFHNIILYSIFLIMQLWVRSWTSLTL
ncbi:hypothetical protein QN277_019753 [Acacia crassicarpa]|uniref:Uncharacterized protein n=1 Tax=Acacia crassicarpa TaxID=499986 RepID=A0AAE1JLG3_9FABA|nr:hypothetical protein QN277_019753 [Acacia crassicarpa]